MTAVSPIAPSAVRRRATRLAVIACVMAVLGVSLGLVLWALRDGISYFATPSDIALGAVTEGQRLRIGGLVEAGSIARGDGAAVTFLVTDQVSAVPVAYVGLLPDLFREGQGVVAEGRYEDGRVVADTVLARHDETYMPREVADALKASGQWKPDGEAY